jgi:hypothetical protein
MTDADLVHAFEATTLETAAFTHTAHVRVAWWYLRHAPLAEAIGQFSRSLRRFAAAKGVPGLYHETITVAFLLVIAERLHEAPDLDWDAFAARYPELFVRRPWILSRYYSQELLDSPRARAAFVMPDRVG